MAELKPNKSLERLFKETEWTLSRLGREVNKIASERGKPTKCSAQTAHQWIKGHIPRGATQSLILEALARELKRPITHIEAGFPDPAKGTNEPASTATELIDLGISDMDPSRRSILGATLFSVALTVPDWQDVVGRMDGIQKGKIRRIGWQDVDTVSAMTERIAELDNQFGGRHARPMAAAFLVNTVAPYLRANASEDTRKAMMSAAADLCALTGYMAHDEGLNGLAQKYYVKTLELTGAAGQHLTYCRTLRAMSTQAYYLGHGPQAMQLADAAADAAPKSGPRLHASITAQQALSAAQIHDRRKALTYLSEAEKSLERAESKENLIRSYDPSAFAAHEAHVRYELGDVKGSVESMKRSQRLLNGALRRVRVHQGTILAERQLKMGHLEAACTTWGTVLDEYPLIQSGRCDKRISNIMTLVKPYLNNGIAKDLYERTHVITHPYD